MGKDFATIGELLNDDVFRKFVSEEIDSIRTKRKNRPMPQEGYRYKRDWFDKMKDADQFNFEYIINVIEDVWLKRSSVSSDIRNAVNSICLTAVQKTSIEYAKTQENNNEKQ